MFVYLVSTMSWTCIFLLALGHVNAPPHINWNLYLVWASHSLLFQVDCNSQTSCRSLWIVWTLDMASRERAWPVADHPLNLQCITTTCLTRTYLHKTGRRKRHWFLFQPLTRWLFKNTVRSSHHTVCLELSLLWSTQERSTKKVRNKVIEASHIIIEQLVQNNHAREWPPTPSMMMTNSKLFQWW